MFWIISAILVGIAIVFILPTLLKQEYTKDGTREQNIAIAREQLADLEHRFEKGSIDEDDYRSTRDELELSLFNDLQESDLDLINKVELNNSKSIYNWLILLLIPLIAVPVYLSLGNLNFTKEFDSKKAALEASDSMLPLTADGAPDMEKVIQTLREKMAADPTDPKGWYMLGRVNMMNGNFPEAAESFEKSLALRPDMTDTMLSLADALSMKNDGQLKGRARELVNKALTLEPQNITALWLSGMAANQDHEYLVAITQWKKLLPFLDDKSDDKFTVEGMIKEAEGRLTPEMKKELPRVASQNDENKKSSVEKTKGITVKISLDDALNDKASPDDLVFIYAKAMKGPPMPLAAVRKQVKDFPLELVLNDEMAMMPDLKLSSFNRVIVGARISKTGQAIPKNGDLYAEKTDISLGDSISLEINKIFKK